MSQRTPWKANVAYSTPFYVTDSSTGLPVTGLVNANFTKKLTKDNVNSVVAVTVTESDAVNQAGKYHADFTPTSVGEWDLVISNVLYQQQWQDTLHVIADDVYDPNVFADALLNRINGVDGTLTPASTFAQIWAATAGVSAGDPVGANSTFKGPSGVVRLTVTYDVSNNRLTAVPS